MYTVFFTNFGYCADERFTTLEAAIEHGKKACFEFTVHTGGKIVAAWSPIGGLHTYGTEIYS